MFYSSLWVGQAVSGVFLFMSGDFFLILLKNNFERIYRKVVRKIQRTPSSYPSSPTVNILPDPLHCTHVCTRSLHTS